MDSRNRILKTVANLMLVCCNVVQSMNVSEESCNASICFPKNYNATKLPANKMTVYTKLVAPETALKKVNDFHMTLTFEPQDLN